MQAKLIPKKLPFMAQAKKLVMESLADSSYISTSLII